jgi:peptidoglycan/LPS O-acetylase OafA/YrhL
VVNSSLASAAVPVLHLSVISDAILGAGFFVLVNAACRTNWLGDAESVSSSLLLRLGMVSYSVYLTHVPLMAAAKVLGLAAGMSPTMLVMLRFAISMFGGYLFYLIVERRFLNSSRRQAGIRTYLPVS